MLYLPCRNRAGLTNMPDVSTALNWNFAPSILMMLISQAVLYGYLITLARRDGQWGSAVRVSHVIYFALGLFLIFIALLYFTYAVCAKRFQDRDKPATMAAYGLGALLLTNLLAALGLTGTPQQFSAIGWVCALINLGVLLWFVIELGILKGTPGPNRFGGDPLAAVR